MLSRFLFGFLACSQPVNLNARRPSQFQKRDIKNARNPQGGHQGFTVPMCTGPTNWPPVHMIKPTEAREITPYRFVHRLGRNAPFGAARNGPPSQSPHVALDHMKFGTFSAPFHGIICNNGRHQQWEPGKFSGGARLR
jgi:hypothetical protein